MTSGGTMKYLKGELLSIDLEACRHLTKKSPLIDPIHAF